jgi:PAS domain S-box-containing protein
MPAPAWALMDQAPCGAVLVDAVGTVICVNEAAKHLLGARSADAVGRPLQLLLPVPLGGSGLDEQIGYQEVDVVDEVGHRRVLALVIRRVGLEPASHVIFIHDLTRERVAEAALAHSQAIAATVRDAVIETDTDFVILSWNRAAEQMYGWAPGEVIGRSSVEVLRSRFADDEVATIVRELDRDGHVLMLAKQLTRADEEIEVEASIIALRDDHGATTGYVAINRDVSRRRQLEDRLRDTRHLEVVGRLAGGVAHDLNTLLTAMLGYTELALADRDLPPAVRPDLQEVLSAAERAGELTRQLLAFSRQQVLTPRVIDVNDVLERTLTARRRLAGKRVELLDHPGTALARVLIDPNRLEQSLLDVVSNAGEAMPEGGRLTIETSMTELDGGAGVPLAGRCVRIAVTDTGPGMEASTRSRAFEPFFTTKDGHTGLGLSTLYGFIGQSGGHVTLESDPGAGTTIALFLPPAR